LLLTRLRIIMKSTIHYAHQIQESHELAEISELVQTSDSCGQRRVRNSIVVRGHEVAWRSSEIEILIVGTALS
jgi:hypothetical protein